MLGARAAHDPRLMGTDAHRRAISLLRFRAFAIELHKHRVVNIRTERALDCFKICPMAIASQLDADCEAGAKVIHEDDRRVTVAASDEPRGDKLRVSVD